jgi:4-oxalocrotonate tautomerase
MPNVTIEGPKLKDVAAKRVLVKEVTDALEKAYKLPRQVYVVTIKENLPENVGVGGVLIVDRKKQKTYKV